MYIKASFSTISEKALYSLIDIGHLQINNSNANICTAFVFFIKLKMTRMKEKRNTLSVICTIIFVIYIFIVFWITLLGRMANGSVNMLLSSFWEYKRFFQHMSFHTAHDIVLNMLMFMPFGFLLPLNFAKIRQLKYIIIFAALFSALIEVGQLLFSRGWCEFDDIFNNTVGAMIGYLVYMIYIKIHKKVEIK